MACTSSNIGFTQIGAHSSQFTWRINKFSSLSYCMKEPEAKLESPIFTTKHNDDIKWQLFLWPNGRDESYSDFLSASLCNPPANNSNVQKNIILSEVNDILLNDVLTIFCELTLTCKKSVKNIDENIQQKPICVDRKVLNAFEQQLEKEEFSDVRLVPSCGKELRAHKFVLAARSPVFSAMFINDMKEKNEPTVAIQDLDYDSLKEMLRFMYAGKVENLDKLVGGVLAAQEKYQIDELKEYCEEFLFHNISIENAVDTLALSIRYNIDKIKCLSSKFIRCHGKAVSETDAFKAVDEPKLLAEIVRILANL